MIYSICFNSLITSNKLFVLLFTPLLFGLTSPLKAEISMQKVKAAQQKLFVLCQLEQGLDKAKLEREANFILQSNGIPTRLIEDKEVVDRAQSLFDEASCDAFPKWVYMLDWVKSVEKDSGKIFSNASKEEQRLMKELSYAVCKYNNKDFTLEERDSYIDNASMGSSVVLDPDNLKRLIEGSVSYLRNLDKNTCSGI